MHNGVLIYILFSMLCKSTCLVLIFLLKKKHFYSNGNLLFFFKYDSCNAAVMYICTSTILENKNLF